MYINGHTSILDEVIDLLDNQNIYFDNTIRDDKVKYSKLRKGMIYPDLPCGKYELINDKNDIFSIMKKKTVCSITRLHKIMGHLDNLKEIFHSHRGINAFLHSMSYNPKLKASNIRDTILSNIMAYAMLSIYDKDYYKDNIIEPSPSIFWIGIILHIITDSYSQSHTIRLEKTTTDVKTERLSWDPYVKFRMLLWELIFKYANDSKKHIIDNETDLQEVLLKKFQKNSIEYNYIKRKKQRLFKAYKMFLFNIQTQNIVKNFVKINPNDDISTSYHKYDIINFQYYNNQPSSYHKKRDLIYHVKKFPDLYEKMLNECKTVLLLYKECLQQIKNNPSKHQVISKKFIKKLIKYLSSNTFRMTKQHLNNKTGTIYKVKYV